MKFPPVFRASFPFRCIFLSLLLCLLSMAASDAALPQRFHQAQEDEPLVGIIGSEIGDIAWSGRYLWVATENGLARLDPAVDTGLLESDWVTFTEFNGLGRGSISALDAVGDVVWAATLFDTVIAGIDPPPQVGAGLSYTTDGGETWEQIANGAIFDPGRPGFARGPTTPIQNACYGLSIAGEAVWAAFFAGSTVRTRDGGRSWERVLPDGAEDVVFFASDTAADSLQVTADSLRQAGGDPEEIARLLVAADSLRSQEFLHRTFDVLAYGDTVWVGTASGLTRSFDGGRTWRNIKARFDADGNLIPGQLGANWTVAIERQILPGGGSVIWTGTRATAPGEVNSIAFSRDEGESWTITGSTAAWGFAFSEERIWAGTDDGLLASRDSGATWEAVVVEDLFSREQLRGTFVGLQEVGGVLWVGAENGLGRSDDEGESWRIIKSPIKPLALDDGAVIGEGGVVDSVRTYAAPTPFAPGQSEQTRIHYSLSEDARVSIWIYDFASRQVRSLIEEEARQGAQNHGENWDGLDDDGDPVANGVYFYRIELDSGRQAFGKVVVLD